MAIPFPLAATLSPGPCAPHVSLGTGNTYKAGAAAKEVCMEARSGLCAGPAAPPASCPNGTTTDLHPSCNGVKVEDPGMLAEEMSSAAFEVEFHPPPAPTHSQQGKLPLPCLQTRAAPPCHDRSTSTGTPLAPTRVATPPLAPSAPAAAAAAAAPSDTMDSNLDSLIVRDRSSSGSKWEPLWARTAVAAAAAALSRMTRSRASSSVSTATCKEDKVEGEDGEGSAQLQPPSLPPCCTSGTETQHQAAVALPRSLDSSSSTPTSFPVAALLSHSLLQALGSPHFPGSPRASIVEGKKAAPEQNQHPGHPALAHRAAACTEPATAEELSREMVQICEASGMATEDAKALVHIIMLIQPDTSMDGFADGLAALMLPTSHGFTTGCYSSELQQQQQQQQQQQGPMEGVVSTAVPTALLPSHSISSQLEKPKGPDPAAVDRIPPSSNSSFTSSSTRSSLPVCTNSDLLRSQERSVDRHLSTGAGGVGRVSLSSRTSSHGCAWEEIDGKQVRRRSDGTLHTVSDAAAPVSAPKPHAHAASSATPHTPWDFTHLLGLLEQQRHKQDTHQQESSSAHGGKQLLNWMEQQQQHGQSYQQGADFPPKLQVHAPFPTSRMPAVPSAHGLAVLDATSASPSPHSTLSTGGGSTVTATALMSPLSSAAPTTDGKVGKGWEDMEDGVRERVFSVCEGCAPHIKLQHFDAGVRHWLVQLTALFGQEAAIKGLNGIVSATNLEGVRNMRAFITTRLIDHHEQLVFQQDPRGYAQRRLMPEQFEMLVELVECRSEGGLLWSHFDPKVLDTVRDLCADYTRSRLQRLSAKELATVKNVPAYIFTLLSKRGKTAKQAAAAKGVVEGALSRFTDAHFPPNMAPRTLGRYGQPFASQPPTAHGGMHPRHSAGASPLGSSPAEELYLPSYDNHYQCLQGHHACPPPPPPPVSRTMAYHPRGICPPTPTEAPPPPKAYCSMAPHTLIYTPSSYPHQTSGALLHAAHGAHMEISPCDPSYAQLYYMPADGYAGCVASSDATAALPYPARAPPTASYPSSRFIGSYNGIPAEYTDSSIPQSSACAAYSTPPTSCGAVPPQFFFPAPFGGQAPFVTMDMELPTAHPLPMFYPYDSRS